MPEDTIVGIPTACLLPVAQYRFKEVVGISTISIPVRGTYPTEYTLDGKPALEGEFDICPEPGVLLLGKITEVLLAFGKYPKLEANQRFVLAGVDVGTDTLEVVGRIVEFVEEKGVEAD
jgi:hypothetical protein